MQDKDDRKSAPTRYGAALACLALALAVRAVLSTWIGHRNPYITAFLAALIAARFWGAGPGWLVAIGGAVGAVGLFRAPLQPVVAPLHDSVGIGLYLFSSCFAVWLIDLLRRTNQQSQQSARLAEQRLAELRERTEERERQQKVSGLLTAIVESSADAIISEDLDGVIQSWNLGAQQVFGYAPAEAIGRSIDILIPRDHIAEKTDIIERVRHGGRVKQFETVRVRKDGTIIPVSLTVSPVRDESGRIFGASLVARDITEQKEMEQQFRQTQKLESLGVLAGGLAHDFNNLLTGIMGNASLALIDPSNTEEVRDRIAEVLAASERAALLVRQMLAYAGKGQVMMEQLDLSEQIHEIVTLLRTSISRTVDLDLQLDPNPPRIEADRSQLQQVIMNLAINGAEAIGDRPGRLTIRTSSREVNGERQVMLQVSDTGCGMDDETKSRIFDPFFTTKFTGRGLGLAAVMGIIRTHSASITVDTALGRGSSFTVIFPAAAAEPAPIGEGEARLELRGYGNILVVDDEDLVRNMAKFTLERCGYSVELANDGKSAVDLFAARPDDFSGVLLDLTMPVMNGEEAMRRIRRLRPDVPVVLSSGFSEAEALDRFSQEGLSGFLQKPYTATTLARRIKQALRRTG